MRLNLTEVQARKALGYNEKNPLGNSYFAKACRRRIEVFPLYDLPAPGVYSCVYCESEVEVIIKVNSAGYVNSFIGMDHVPPLDWFVRNPDVVPNPEVMRCVPCCTECNYILGPMYVEDVVLKRTLILDRLSARLVDEVVPQVFVAPATSRKWSGEISRLISKIARLRALTSSA